MDLGELILIDLDTLPGFVSHKVYPLLFFITCTVSDFLDVGMNFGPI